MKEDLTVAYVEGVKKLRKKVENNIISDVPQNELKPVQGGSITGTGGYYDDSFALANPQMASGTKVLLTTVLKPGQRLSNFNTTIRNPRRCDKEVEAHLGKHVYKARVEPDSTRELRKELNDTKQKLETLMRLVAKEKQEKQTVSEPADSTEPEPVEVPPADWNQLRKFAKEKGINTKGKNKDEILAELNVGSA